MERKANCLHIPSHLWVTVRLSGGHKKSAVRKRRESSEAGFTGFMGFSGLGVGNRSSLLQKITNTPKRSTLMVVFLLSTSSYIFIERTTKTRTFMPSKSRLGACCLTILIYISFIMFKGAMRPRYTYVPRL